MSGEPSASALLRDASKLRKEYVDRIVTRKIDHRDGDVTCEQIEAWEADAHRRWREEYPALTLLFLPHGATS